MSTIIRIAIDVIPGTKTVFDFRGSHNHLGLVEVIDNRPHRQLPQTRTLVLRDAAGAYHHRAVSDSTVFTIEAR